jgi:PKD repeat protein
MIVNETGQTMTGTFGQYWRGLESVYSPDSVNLTAVSGYLFGNGTDFLYYGLNVRMGSTFTISGKWFSFGAITILWDGTTVIDSTMSDQNGSFKTTLTVPPHTSEGRHNVVVKDANVKFTFKLNCLPLIDTQPPVANARSILTIPENTLVIFDGSRSTDNIGIASYVWSFIDVTTHLLTGVNPAYNFTRPGTYFVLLNVTDFGGNWDTDTTIVKVLDTIPPIADVGPNRTIDEDASVTFDGSNSYDNVGITKYMWTISDFNETFFSTKITYTFMKPGVYTVTLTVFDAAGNQGMDVAFVTVRDITPPVANAGSNRTVMEDTIVTFDGSFSRDIYIGIVSYKWDFGDGSKGIGQIANHTYTNPGRYNVTLTVKDAANNSDSASITVTVMRNNINEQPLIFSYLIPVTVLAAIMAAIVIALFAKVKVKITREEFVQRELSLFRDQFADLEKKNLIYYEWKLTTIRQEAEKKFDELRQKGYLVSNLVELRQVLARKLRYNIKRLKGKRKKNK